MNLTPLEQETRSALPTDEAAAHLNRQQQTLRYWSCSQTGPLQPVRVHGRLMWKTDDLRRVLGIETNKK